MARQTVGEFQLDAVTKALGTKDIKLIIVVNSEGKQTLLRPKGNPVVKVPKPVITKKGPGGKHQTLLPPNGLFDVTYLDGDKGWCWISNGKLVCYP